MLRVASPFWTRTIRTCAGGAGLGRVSAVEGLQPQSAESAARQRTAAAELKKIFRMKLCFHGFGCGCCIALKPQIQDWNNEKNEKGCSPHSANHRAGERNV